MRRSALLLLAAAPLLLGSVAAPRCDCSARASVPYALREATAVFSGRVVSAHDGRVRIRVERAWKRTEPGAVVEVQGQHLRPDGTIISNCEYFFEIGKGYLVYAYGSPDRLGTSVCTRTTSIERAASDVEELDNPRPPGRDERIPPPDFFCLTGLVEPEPPAFSLSDIHFPRLLIKIAELLTFNHPDHPS